MLTNPEKEGEAGRRDRFVSSLGGGNSLTRKRGVDEKGELTINFDGPGSENKKIIRLGEETGFVWGSSIGTKKGALGHYRMETFTLEREVVAWFSKS